jgi:hypothetical protein
VKVHFLLLKAAVFAPGRRARRSAAGFSCAEDFRAFGSSAQGRFLIFFGFMFILAPVIFVPSPRCTTSFATCFAADFELQLALTAAFLAKCSPNCL